MPFPNPKFSEIKTTTEQNRGVAVPKGKKPPKAAPKPQFGKQAGAPSVPSPKPAAAATPDIPPATGTAPPVGEGESKPGYDRSSHFKGNPGFAEGRQEPNQSYHDEQKEHWGDKAQGPPKQGSDVPCASQPQGHSVGVPPLGAHHSGHSFGTPHSFRNMRGNPTPPSGNPRAHRIGGKR